MENHFKIIDLHAEKFSVEKVERLLLEIDDDFHPKLSQKVEFSQYAHKIYTKSKIFAAVYQCKNKIYGILSLYCNDPSFTNAYIPLFWVDSSVRGRGIARKLLNHGIYYLNQLGFSHLELETWDESNALKFYKAMGFKEINRINNRPGNINSVFLRYKLNDA